MPVRPAVDADLLLPSGAVLVHMGPFKTGSSALQQSLSSRRVELAEHGVLYPGTTYRHLRPIAALMGRSPRGVNVVPEQEWSELVAEVADSAAERTVISSEGLSTAGVRVARRLVTDLGSDRVHVVRVERRLDRLLPSAWQERIKSSNEARPYPAFLDDVLAADPATAEGTEVSFWAAHSLEKFLERWSKVVPVDRIHVVIADERDALATTAVFERLLGLPSGMLDPTERPNSSLSWERVELCRRLNELFDEHGWPDKLRRRLLQQAVAVGLTQTPAGEHDSPIPPVTGDRLRRTAELSAARIDLLTGSGIDVIGDPEQTRVTFDATAGGSAPPLPDPEPPATVAIDAVVAAFELLVADIQQRKGRPSPGQKQVDST